MTKLSWQQRVKEAHDYLDLMIEEWGFDYLQVAGLTEKELVEWAEEEMARADHYFNEQAGGDNE